MNKFFYKWQIYTERFNLNARDVVYVDASGLATWNRIIGLILPSVNGVYGGIGAARNVELIMNGK